MIEIITSGLFPNSSLYGGPSGRQCELFFATEHTHTDKHVHTVYTHTHNFEKDFGSSNLYLDITGMIIQIWGGQVLDEDMTISMETSRLGLTGRKDSRVETTCPMLQKGWPHADHPWVKPEGVSRVFQACVSI